MTNAKFAISVHILTLLATTKEAWISSDFIAGSIQINPVLVRKELINLRENGFIRSKEGKMGGSQLAKRARDINMAEVYQAVKEVTFLGKPIPSPNPACPIGRQINQSLHNLYTEAEKSLVASLRKKTLEEFSASFSLK